MYSFGIDRVPAGHLIGRHVLSENIDFEEAIEMNKVQ